MTQKRVMGNLLAPPRKTRDHWIEDLRWRRQSPEHNFIQCVCDYRSEGPTANVEYDEHRRNPGRTGA